MIESIKSFLIKWNTTADERAKLQHVYMLLTIGLVLAAGIVGLVNHALGQNILMVAILSAGVFLVNAVIWALLQSAVLGRLPRRANARNGKNK